MAKRWNIDITVIWTLPAEAMQKSFAKCIEVSLRALPYWWLKNYGERHFTQQAPRRYGYGEYSKGYARRKVRREGRNYTIEHGKKIWGTEIEKAAADAVKPLVWSGDFHRQFMSTIPDVTVHWTRRVQKVRGIWRGLPRYVYYHVRPTRWGAHNVASEATRVTASEATEIAKHFKWLVGEGLRKERKLRSKKYVMKGFGG